MVPPFTTAAERLAFIERGVDQLACEIDAPPVSFPREITKPSPTQSARLRTIYMPGAFLVAALHDLD